MTRPGRWMRRLDHPRRPAIGVEVFLAQRLAAAARNDALAVAAGARAAAAPPRWRRWRGSRSAARSNQPASSSAIAIDSGSSPVAHGTLQMRIVPRVRCEPAAARSTSTSARNWSTSRQKYVSCTDSASMARRHSCVRARRRTSAGSSSRGTNRTRARRERRQPVAQQSQPRVVVAQPGALVHEIAQQRRAPLGTRRPRVSGNAGGMRWHGSRSSRRSRPPAQP